MREGMNPPSLPRLVLCFWVLIEQNGCLALVPVTSPESSPQFKLLIID